MKTMYLQYSSKDHKRAPSTIKYMEVKGSAISMIKPLSPNRKGFYIRFIDGCDRCFSDDMNLVIDYLEISNKKIDNKPFLNRDDWEPVSVIKAREFMKGHPMRGRL